MEGGAPGDILAFLTSQAEIDAMFDKVSDLCGDRALVLPLHGKLDTDDQRKVFDPAPPGKRKVVLATNAAETSLTIDGIRFVIDCGFAKEKLFNPARNVEELVLRRIPRSSATQRAGRAGRTGAYFYFSTHVRTRY